MSEWGTISFEIPDFLEDVREAINDVAELLLTLLDILLAALQLIKAFAVAFLDPLAAILRALINAINAFLDDFRQLGLYITGDWALLEYPFEDLRGGYQRYEQRMVSRLTDRTDSTRPDVSSATSVFAAFFYTSVDISNIQRLIIFIKQILALFHQKHNAAGSPPIPYVTGVKYGAEALGAFGALENLVRFEPAPPDKAKVVWKVAPPASKNPFNPFPALPPGGFLVTVSTLPEGLPLAYSRPQGNTNTGKDKNDKSVQPREYGRVLESGTGKPLVLHGGYEMLANPSSCGYNEALSGGSLRDGATQVYGLLSPAKTEVVPLPQLKQGNTYFYQRTFEVSNLSAGFQWPLQEYSITLDYADMPHHAEVEKQADGTMKLIDLGVPTTLYVRIASRADSNTSNNPGAEAPKFQWDLASAKTSGYMAGSPFNVQLLKSLDPTSISSWSQAAKLSFPTVNTKKCLEAITAALVVLALSRSDLPVVDDLEENKGAAETNAARQHRILIQDVALLRTGLEPFKYLLDMMFPSGFGKFIESVGSPLEFRRSLLETARRTAKQLFDRAGLNNDLQAFIVDGTRRLREATVEEMLDGAGERMMADAFVLPSVTLLSSLEEDVAFAGLPPTDMGIAANPHAASISPTNVDGLFMIPNAIRLRKPDFIEVGGSDSFDFESVIAAKDVPARMAAASPALKMFYEKFKQADGSIFIPTDVAEYMTALRAQRRLVGSADQSPVFYSGAAFLRQLGGRGGVVEYNPDQSEGAGMVYCRSVFRLFEGGVLYGQSAIALNAMAAMTRPPQDGEWIAVRFFDTIPGLDDFFTSIQQWLDALGEAIKSIADAIIQYIEFVEARIIELQQLIRRINAMLQSILSFSLGMPACSGLLLLAKGTDGVLAGLMTSENKPFDSPLSYGGGIAIVAPFAPAFLIDLLTLGDGDPNGEMGLTSAGDAFGALPAGPVAPPDDEPDVL